MITAINILFCLTFETLSSPKTFSEAQCMNGKNPCVLCAEARKLPHQLPPLKTFDWYLDYCVVSALCSGFIHESCVCQYLLNTEEHY